ncbi:hypothetical protein AB1N83_011856 [Pleurotus pulmonarius]
MVDGAEANEPTYKKVVYERPSQSVPKMRPRIRERNLGRLDCSTAQERVVRMCSAVVVPTQFRTIESRIIDFRRANPCSIARDQNQNITTYLTRCPQTDGGNSPSLRCCQPLWQPQRRFTFKPPLAAYSLSIDVNAPPLRRSRRYFATLPSELAPFSQGERSAAAIFANLMPKVTARVHGPRQKIRARRVVDKHTSALAGSPTGHIHRNRGWHLASVSNGTEASWPLSTPGVAAKSLPNRHAMPCDQSENPAPNTVSAFSVLITFKFSFRGNVLRVGATLSNRRRIDLSNVCSVYTIKRLRLVSN